MLAYRLLLHRGGLWLGGPDGVQTGASPFWCQVTSHNHHGATIRITGACALDLELATQDFEDELQASLYPFNAARNRALMLAQTEASFDSRSAAYLRAAYLLCGRAQLIGWLPGPQLEMEPALHVLTHTLTQRCHMPLA